METVYANFIKEIETIENIEAVQHIFEYCYIFFKNPKYPFKACFDNLNNSLRDKNGLNYFISKEYPLQILQLIPNTGAEVTLSCKEDEKYKKIIVFENREQFNTELKIMREQVQSLDKILNSNKTIIGKDLLKQNIQECISILRFIDGSYQKAHNEIFKLIKNNELIGG